MSYQEDTYSAFLLDHAVGAVTPAERLLVDLHARLSPGGGAAVSLWDAVGGALIERADASPGRPPPVEPPDEADPRLAAPAKGEGGSQPLDFYLSGDLLGLRWRKSIFGVRQHPAHIPGAHLLRLDPGSWAPRHGHSRREVTLVLRGAFEDEHGRYGAGDLAFCEPGLVHRPAVVGDEPCVCLVTSGAAQPLGGVLGWLGLGAGSGVWRDGAVRRTQ